MSQTPLTPFVTSFASQLISHTPELMKDLFVPAAQEHGAQWLDERFGAVRYHDPLSNRSLMGLLDRLALLAASMCEVLMSKEVLSAIQPVMAAQTAAAVPAVPTLAVDPAAVGPHPTFGTQNGVTPPKSGVTLQIWQIADELTKTRSQEGQPPASRGNVVAAAKAAGINEGTASSQYGKWALFHSINPKDPSLPFEAKQAKTPKVASAATPPANPEVKDTTLLYLMHPESSSAFVGVRADLADGTVIEIGQVGPAGVSQEDYANACRTAGIDQPFPLDIPPACALPALSMAPPPPIPAYAPPPPIPAYAPPPPIPA